MYKCIVILSVLVIFVNSTQQPSASQNGNTNKQPEDMNKKIKGIAQGIVDKWIAEGITITKDKVEGWIDILDKAQTKGKEQNQNASPEIKKTTPKPPPVKNPEDLGGDFKQVRDTLVKTFTDIGKVKCTDCKKTDGNTNHHHKNELNKNVDLESLSVDELIKKQETIKKFLQMENMAKLANSFSELEKLKDIASLAKTLNTLQTTPKEEL